MKAAGIPIEDKLHRKLDFHTLRYTTGVRLGYAGVAPGMIQHIMRHSTIALTMDPYGLNFEGTDCKVVNESMPDVITKIFSNEAYGSDEASQDDDESPAVNDGPDNSGQDKACPMLTCGMGSHDPHRPSNARYRNIRQRITKQKTLRS